MSPCLFNLYAKYIMQNARLDESKAGVKISGTNINNLRYADDITLMAESKEELRSLLMKEKEESEESGFILNIQKTRIMASGTITSRQIDGKKWKLTDFIFQDSKINADSDASMLQSMVSQMVRHNLVTENHKQQRTMVVMYSKIEKG